MQTVELLWLNSLKRPLGWKAVCAYAHLSIILHIAFATLVSMLSTNEDSHYTVLLVLPVIAAAFRYSLFRHVGRRGAGRGSHPAPGLGLLSRPRRR